MSLFEKYSAEDDQEIFVNFIENQFKLKDFESIISVEYTDRFTIEFKPTDRCNFDCSYCCFHDNKAPHLSDEQFENYKKVLLSMNIDKPDIFLFVYGGEPTKHPKLMEWIIEIRNLFPDKGFKALIQSNGMWWKVDQYKEECKKLLDEDIDFVFSFSYHEEFANVPEMKKRIDYLLSIDKFEVLTYMITRRGINKHIQNIKFFNALKIPLYVRTILQESEWFLTSEYAQYVTRATDEPYIVTDKEGVHHYSFEDLTMRGYLNFKGYNCSAGQNAILMASNGKIYRCDMDFLYDRNEMYDTNVSLEPKYQIDKCLKCDHKFCSIYYGDKWK